MAYNNTYDTMKSYTRYYYPRTEGMKLRSGRLLNCIVNDKELTAYSNQLGVIMRETDFTLNKCKLLRTIFVFMNKYHDLIVNDINFINNHRMLRLKFDEFIRTFEEDYYDNERKKNKSKYFCRCCPKRGASWDDVRKGIPEAFEKEIHCNEETRQNLVKWSTYLKQPHHKYRKAHDMITTKTNQDIASKIIGYL
jgi:hypothetical protein